ncbi:Spx/MgsR family RNA polymerase-binding regulatory protein [Proteiniclasticum sp.]|uniref:Spx/MgsR family RNA polymerase-binding regulatory protein n=1 Tax=Proteiniclasticum sp. TaxID=2053595 RepID=UPI002898B3BA|nr:Spx/MgsR family RNA polymerase-binding regulatory protein [Proteiniclasticum sp.]
MELVCYAKCGTCMKAKKFLMANNLDYEYREIVSMPLSVEELRDVYRKCGLPIKKLLNTSGLVYRELEMKEKVKTYSDEEILKLLSEHPMLVKRPVLRKEDVVLIGFEEQEWTEKLLKE